MSITLSSRRVVVTGIGAVTALAGNARETWARLIQGETGIRTAANLDPAIHKCTVRASVADDAIPQRMLVGKQLKTASRFTRMAMEAAGEAMRLAGLIDAESLEPTIDLAHGGTTLGTCLGGVYDDLLPAHEAYLASGGAPRISPHLHVTFPHNMASYTIHQRFGMTGPTSTIATACATGAQAIGEGFHTVRNGCAPFVIAGAMESTMHPLFGLGFEAMRALCTDSNATPGAASRPFDATRSGFVLGEGAGMLVLEELDHALARNVPILCEIAGYATSNDAYHPIAPRPDGSGAAEAIRKAIADAGLTPNEIDHINAHAASTPAGDLAEAHAIRLVFGERGSQVPVTSVKGAFGHGMAASGAIESVMSVLTMVEQLMPPTRNHRQPDRDVNLNVVSTPTPATIGAMTKHSFGLGGQNAALVFRAWHG